MSRPALGFALRRDERRCRRYSESGQVRIYVTKIPNRVSHPGQTIYGAEEGRLAILCSMKTWRGYGGGVGWLEFGAQFGDLNNDGTVDLM